MKEEKFWEVEALGKHSINEEKFKVFLEKNGFFKRKVSNDYYEIIRKDLGRTERIHLFEVKYFVLKYLIDNNISKYVFSIIDKKKYFNVNFLTEFK